MCVCKCVYTCVHIHEEARNQPQGSFPSDIYADFLRHGLSLGLVLTHKLGLDVWPASPRVLPVCILPCIRMTRRSHHSQVFLVASGAHTQVFMFPWQVFHSAASQSRAWDTGHDFFHTKNGFYDYIMSQHRVKSRFKNSIAMCKCSLWSVASTSDRTEEEALLPSPSLPELPRKNWQGDPGCLGPYSPFPSLLVWQPRERRLMSRASFQCLDKFTRIYLDFVFFSFSEPKVSTSHPIHHQERQPSERVNRQTPFLQRSKMATAWDRKTR